MKSGISRYTLGSFNQTALDDVYNKAKEIYVGDVTPPSSGLIVNTTDIIWDDSFGLNIGDPCATCDCIGQFEGGDRPNYPGIGSTFRIPTSNLWNEIEEEGDGSSCSRTINQAVNTRVELGDFKGWWLDGNGNWNEISQPATQDGTQHPPIDGLVDGERECYDPYFNEVRADFDKSLLIKPYNGSNYINLQEQHIFVKPQKYYRFHGWSNACQKYANEYTTCKGLFYQQYARLVVDDSTGVDDRHLARYIIHLGMDRKETDCSSQLWHIGITRFKRVTNDWQPFNMYAGPMTQQEFEANPPPFDSVP